MKKSLIIVVLLFFVGCRPTEKIIDRRVDIDSTSLIKLKSDITKIEKKTVFLEKKVLENINIKEELKTKINATVETYDTDKPNNPIKTRVVYRKDIEWKKELEKLKKETEYLAGRVGSLEFRLDSVTSQNKLFKKELEKVKQKPRLTIFEKWSIRGFWVLIGLMIIGIFVKLKFG